MVGYCSETCRVQHLDQHRVECELCVLRGRGTWPHRAWFVSRAVLKVQSEGYLEKEKINNKRSRTFHDLMDHYDDITNDPSLGECWYKEVSTLLGSLMPEKEEYLRIYGRLAVNSFSLRVDNNGEEESVGTVLYRAASIFDHSCSPTATTVFNPGGVLEIKSMVSSPRMNLNSFFITYLDDADPRLNRLAKLSRTWYFPCGCSKCLDQNSEGEKHAALCQEETCKGEVHVNIENWSWQPCSTCSVNLSSGGKEKYKEVYQLVREVIDENGGECNFTDVAEFLVRQMEKVFHSSDLEIMQASISAAQGNYVDKNWKKSIYYQTLAIIGIRL
ncbi:histone-lysine N-methyltransferase SMYD3 [Eurytemora carolleeae]|uniref:histone-lysine N-methyltransferase SMYD3 n=1 Tax=Eurytemora carolleeae TaxID=1294199 RepID=UPI000C77CDD8|nr:histone-lysine N-methyltransferase SMYD3 [Eurytemora carolleeae]|eukprot:XP_023327640.1 histone-lysine N-methyltransferase SMYD3-like [Eurytemora affinis]